MSLTVRKVLLLVSAILFALAFFGVFSGWAGAFFLALAFLFE